MQQLFLAHLPGVAELVARNCIFCRIEVVIVKEKDRIIGCRQCRASACHLASTVLQCTARECSCGCGCLTSACSSIRVHQPTYCGKHAMSQGHMTQGYIA